MAKDSIMGVQVLGAGGPYPRLAFKLLAADNPHAFRTYSGKNQTPTLKKLAAGQESAHYPVSILTQEDQENLPIAQVAADRSSLFFWINWSLQEENYQIIRAWGFKPTAGGFNWVKLNPSGEGFHMGMGFSTRYGSEIAVQCSRRLPPSGRRKKEKVQGLSRSAGAGGVRQVILAPIRGHSEKPQEFFNRLDILYPHVFPRLELFGRVKRPGWLVLGNEIDGLDIRQSLKMVLEGTYPYQEEELAFIQGQDRLTQLLKSA